jgi:transketolase
MSSQVVMSSEIASASGIDQLCINTVRTLSIDAVQQANSGHPGTPMALAPVAYCLWQRFLRFDSEDPIWPNRDRFILKRTLQCCCIPFCTSLA